MKSEWGSKIISCRELENCFGLPEIQNYLYFVHLRYILKRNVSFVLSASYSLQNTADNILSLSLPLSDYYSSRRTIVCDTFRKECSNYSSHSRQHQEWFLTTRRSSNGLQRFRSTRFERHQPSIGRLATFENPFRLHFSATSDKVLFDFFGC